jgi:glycosyltransferase involved in cell wall biosynthesis
MSMGDPGEFVNHPAISVIVPVCNGECFLAEALRSIGQQAYQPLEVLVVDDGSTDDSASIAVAQPGVRVLPKPHSGLGATLNYGIAHATGELFAFLDADDRWLPGKLVRQVAELIHRPELDLVFCHGRQFTSREEIDGEREDFSAPQPAISKTALLIRRVSFHRVGEFSENAAEHDFLGWYARAQAAGLSAAIVPEVLIERRIHDNNIGRMDPAAQRRRYLSTLRAVVNQRRQSSMSEAPNP